MTVKGDLFEVAGGQKILAITEVQLSRAGAANPCAAKNPCAVKK